MEEEALNWLTALPLKRYNFTQAKSKFRDVICIRYNIEAKNAPINYPCGEKFTLSHALHCTKRAWYAHIGHNDIRNTAENINDFCYEAEVGPTLQLLQSEPFIQKTNRTDKNGQLDIKAEGRWGSRFNCCFFGLTRLITKLASKNAEGKDESYSDPLTYIRTKISFALLRSAIIWLSGCQTADRF